MKRIDLTKEMPTNKGELNKKNMTAYVKAKGTVEDKFWFADLLEKNKVLKESNLPNTEASFGLDLHKVREAFCVHFCDFYFLSDKSKRENRVKEESLDDIIKALREEAEKASLALAG